VLPLTTYILALTAPLAFHRLVFSSYQIISLLTTRAESIRHLAISLQLCERFVCSFVHRVFWDVRVQFGTYRFLWNVGVQLGEQMIIWDACLQFGTHRFLWIDGVQLGEQMIIWDACLQFGTHRFLWNGGVQFCTQDILGCVQFGAQRVFQDETQIRCSGSLHVSTNTTTSGINMIIIIKLVTII
jgi:hypothetical protein